MPEVDEELTMWAKRSQVETDAVLAEWDAGALPVERGSMWPVGTPFGVRFQWAMDHNCQCRECQLGHACWNDCLVEATNG